MDMVSIEAELDWAVITAGEKLHDIPTGKSEQDREIEFCEPEFAVTIMPELPDCTSAMTTDDGDVLSESIGAGCGAGEGGGGDTGGGPGVSDPPHWA